MDFGEMTYSRTEPGNIQDGTSTITAESKEVPPAQNTHALIVANGHESTDRSFQWTEVKNLGNKINYHWIITQVLLKKYA